MQKSVPLLGAVRRVQRRWFEETACSYQPQGKRLGRRSLSEPSRDLLEREIPRNNLELLPINLAHATTVETLPPHHKDPFDRLLIAQAIIEQTPLVSADEKLDSYSVTRIW